MKTKIRWGILSTAQIARNRLIPAIRESSNSEVLAIASRTGSAAEKSAQEHGIPRSYGSYEELIRDPDVDAIYNPLPVALHAEWSIRCLEAGKPVLCEKPLASNSREAGEMKAASMKTNVLLGEAIMYHFHPLTRAAVDLAKAGTIGKIQTVRSTFHVRHSGEKNNIRMQKNMSGGGLLDVGSYCISLIRQVAGEEPDAVTAFNQIGKESRVDETFEGLLHFPSGIAGYFSCSLRTFFDCSYEISGSTGRILIDHGGMCAWPGEEFKIRVWSDDTAYREILIPPANAYTLMTEDFAEAILFKRPYAIALEESMRNLETLDRLVNEARVFQIDPLPTT